MDFSRECGQVVDKLAQAIRRLKVWTDLCIYGGEGGGSHTVAQVGLELSRLSSIYLPLGWNRRHGLPYSTTHAVEMAIGRDFY